MGQVFEHLFEGGLTQSFFSTPLQAFGWRDVLDILLLAVLLFTVYRYVRDRRAGRLLIGVGALALIYIASEVLDMYAVRYLFANFFGYSLIVVAIVFQPELRTLLERVGTFSFKRLKNIAPDARGRSTLTVEALDEIVLAVKNMAYKKRGALIAIERSIKITEYAESGTVLDSVISSRLLEGLFADKEPLHDGAVIVRDGRLFAAGCNLPLTHNVDPIKELGTRHRAAVGASEDTDAIVIVVSEETGIVSLACNGELIRNLTSVSLRRHLCELLGMQKNQNVGEETK